MPNVEAGCPSKPRLKTCATRFASQHCCSIGSPARPQACVQRVQHARLHRAGHMGQRGIGKRRVARLILHPAPG